MIYSKWWILAFYSYSSRWPYYLFTYRVLIEQTPPQPLLDRRGKANTFLSEDIFPSIKREKLPLTPFHSATLRTCLCKEGG
jgi:hypothetical protein